MTGLTPSSVVKILTFYFFLLNI